MTFSALWTQIKTVWHSRPLALLIPVVALAKFWWTHGHTWTAASFPTMSEWTLGSALLLTKFGRILALFFGEPDPATLPTPVKTPLLNPSGGAGGAVVLMLALGLTLAACAHFNAIVQACKDCVAQDGPQDLRDLEAQAGPLIEHVLMCDPTLTAVALPPCVGQGLTGVIVAMGPDGLRFRDCVLAKIDADPAAPALAKKRAHVVRLKLAVGAPL